MTDEERGHIRHIASVARTARREVKLNPTYDNYNRLLDMLEEIESSAKHALAASLPTVMS